MKTIQKTVHYKKAVITNSDGELINKTLEEYLKLAFDNDHLKNPIEYTTVSGSKYALKTTKQVKLFSRNLCTCSWIVKFTPGRQVPITDSNNLGVINDLVKPIDSKGVVRHLQESYMVFAVQGNHIAFIATHASRLTDLESFFRYFLEHIAKVFSSITLYLKSVPSPKVISATEFESEIKSFNFKEYSFDRNYVPESVEGKKSKKKTLKIQPRRFFDALLSIIPSKESSIVKDIIDSGIDPGQLQLGLTIRYTTKNNENGRPLLAALANSFGDINGAMPSLTLKNDRVISGEEILIKGKIDIQSASQEASRDISFDDALTQISLWLSQSIKDGTIPK